MITILTTSYFDQTQAVGLNTVFVYSGFDVAVVVVGCMTVTFDSKQPSVEFDSQQPLIEFDSEQPLITFKGRCV